MLFNSLQFLIYFPIVTILYFWLPHKYRWFLLLTASVIFYMAFIPKYILILLVTILVDYFSAIWMEKTEGKLRKIFLVTSLTTTFSILFVFKYFNFFAVNLTSLAHIIGWNYSIESLGIILPLGLSFHTFQGMSYIIEVYRGKFKAEKNLGIYALYVMFYPQLVAGPIERPQNLIHQFYEEHKFDYIRVTDGLKLMAWGMFKKVVIADRLAVLVNWVYNDIHSFTGFPIFIATIFFSFQIYCDFSGYTDIARGAASVMGFNLMKNFDRPYFSKSISEFWKRWHISLSTWFRDYLYIPLGGNRVSTFRWYFNLFFVFLVSGLWHGASWTFIIWGGLHGLYLIFSIITKKLREKVKNFVGLNKYKQINKLIQIITTFCLVSFAWIFFRANNLSDAIYVVKNILTWIPKSFSALISFNFNYFIDLIKSVLNLGLSSLGVFLSIFSIFILICAQLIQRKNGVIKLISKKPLFVRWALYYSLIISIIVFGFYHAGNQQFIYFQF